MTWLPAYPYAGCIGSRILRLLRRLTTRKDHVELDTS